MGVRSVITFAVDLYYKSQFRGYLINLVFNHIHLAYLIEILCYKDSARLSRHVDSNLRRLSLHGPLVGMEIDTW